MQIRYKKEVEFGGYILFLYFCLSKCEISFCFVFCFLTSPLAVGQSNTTRTTLLVEKKSVVEAERNNWKNINLVILFILNSM